MKVSASNNMRESRKNTGGGDKSLSGGAGRGRRNNLMFAGEGHICIFLVISQHMCKLKTFEFPTPPPLSRYAAMVILVILTVNFTF